MEVRFTSHSSDSSAEQSVPIPVTCRCGQSFAAGDHLAGRTLQCPKCKSPLTIPAPQAAAPVAPSPFAPAPAPGAQPFAAGPSIFDDAGMRNFTPGKPLCPSCNADLQPNAVLCVKCGFNLQIGKKVTSYVKAPTTSGHDAHGVAAADLLTRAARMIDEDAESKKKEFKQGMPWWMLGAIFLFTVSTVVTLLILPARQAIAYASWAVVFGACVSIIYNMVLLLIIAFNDRPLHGLLLIVNPGYAPLYVLARWESTNHIFWGIVRTLLGSLAVLILLGIAALVARFTPQPEIQKSQATPRTETVWVCRESPIAKYC